MKRTLISLIVVTLVVGLTTIAFLGWSGSREAAREADDVSSEAADKQPSEPQRDESNDTAPGTDGPVAYTSANGVVLRLDDPVQGVALSSPLTIRGQVPGTWSFEASFPVELRAADGSLLAQEPAQLQGDWMTEDYVPFEVVLTFDAPDQKTGTIVLRKDNPSGLSEHEDSVVVPVRFE